ncbi:MAG: COX15/CtaA family protein [Anaerolineales bacterium]|nr:COX15/CtaA family protein [Anaerolineales bacterium]
MARALDGPLHFANTYLLLAALTLTATLGDTQRSAVWRGERRLVLLGSLTLVCLLVVGMSGAVTALGDTLFRPASLTAGIAQELAPASHPLVRMRLIHPLVAVLSSMITAYYALTLKERAPDSTRRRGAATLWALLAAQLGAGAANVVLLAPLGLQVFHLMLSDLIWILVVALSAGVLTATE